MNAVSRRFEWQADQFACELEDKLKAPEMEDMGERLGRALTTLHVKNLSTVWVDWMYVLSTYVSCRLAEQTVLGIPHTTIHILR